MQQWQSITAEPMTTGEALTLFEPIEPIDDTPTPAEQRAIRRINTPFDGSSKSIQCLRLDHWAGQGQRPEATIRRALNCVHWAVFEDDQTYITDQQVITSIKHAGQAEDA